MTTSENSFAIMLGRTEPLDNELRYFKLRISRVST
jgi:hypothetical protein